MVNNIKKSSEKLSEFIYKETNRCVSCGLCVPHCPTYRLLASEADSPRGRIAMMSGVAQGKIKLNKRFILHMDRCLTCRACESVCPNNVSYGQLIDHTRHLIVQSEHKKKSILRRFLERQLAFKPWCFNRMRGWFNFLQRKGLFLWLFKSGSFEKTGLIEQLAKLPPSSFPYVPEKNKSKTKPALWQTVYPAEGNKRGEVGLFLGCVARLTDVETLNASIFVLNRLGYTVHVPSSQVCCGAVHQHSGEPDIAFELSRQNESAFTGLDAIIATASGCGVQLNENSQSLSPVVDISKFLNMAGGWEAVNISPLPYKVAVHEPCTLRNMLKDHAYPYQLIERIPDIQMIPLAGNDQCCGAAGTYFMDQTELARKLRDAKITAVMEDDAIRYLVTSNVGCAMHITTGLHGMADKVEVMHPVTLLARQMGLQ